MKKVTYHEIDRWGWECPECNEWNEEDDDPSYSESLTCQTCSSDFEPVPG